jgi:hypothetical protein
MLIALESGWRTVDSGPSTREQERHELVERQLPPHDELEKDRQVDTRHDDQVCGLLNATASGKAAAAALQISEHDRRLTCGKVPDFLRERIGPKAAIAQWLQKVTVNAGNVLHGIDHSGGHIAVRDDNSTHV